MSSSEVNAAASISAPATKPTGRFANPWVRAAVSLMLAYHLIAVLVEPLAIPPRFFSPEPTRLPEAARPAFQPYMTALNLNQGYRFFAPDPGDSHLIRYNLYFADGTSAINDPDNKFPDRQRDWPRLLYHRYFMLAEHLPTVGHDFSNWQEPDPTFMPPTNEVVAGVVGEFVPPVADDASRGEQPNGVAANEDRRPPQMQLRDVTVRGFAAYLAKKHDAIGVDVYHVVHRLSRDSEIVAGRKIDQGDTYRERLLISYQVPGAKPAPRQPNGVPPSDTKPTGALSPSEARR